MNALTFITTVDAQPSNRKTAELFLVKCLEVFGGAFHPDNDGADYINRSNEPTFTDKEAEQYDINLTVALEYFTTDDSEGNVYAWCMDKLDKGEINMERKFEMTGFKHVTEKGVVAYMCAMDSEGSISMLWDMTNQRRADILMLTKDFDMSKYITETFGYCDEAPEFDEIMIELHEEMVDARFALEHAFIQNLTDIDCPVGERTFRNMDCITRGDVWDSPVMYPLPTPVIFTDISGEFAKYCHEQTVNYEVWATILTNEPVDENGNGYVPQELTWRITGAADFNAFQDTVDSLTEHHCYHNLQVSAILK